MYRLLDIYCIYTHIYLSSRAPYWRRSKGGLLNRERDFRLFVSPYFTFFLSFCLPVWKLFEVIFGFYFFSFDLSFYSNSNSDAILVPPISRSSLSIFASIHKTDRFLSFLRIIHIFFILKIDNYLKIMKSLKKCQGFMNKQIIWNLTGYTPLKE